MPAATHPSWVHQHTRNLYVHASILCLLCANATQDGFSSDGSLGMDRTSDSDSDAAGVRSDGSSGERDPLDRRETVLCDRLRVVMQSITVLAGTRLEGRPMEKLVSSASRVFRTITKVSFYFLSLQCYILTRSIFP